MRPTLFFLLTALALLLFQFTFSQAICGFDIIHKRKMKEDAVYRKNVLAGEASIRTYLRAHPALMQPPKKITAAQTGAPDPPAGPVYTIPIVVHVVHTGGNLGSIYNPTDAQIIETVRYLNNVYNGSVTDPAGAGDLQFRFVLAQRDPNCNPTNGINHINGSSIPHYVSGGVQAAQNVVGTADINVKNLIRWDPSLYYNIWVVNKIDGKDGSSGGFIAGFTPLPAPGTEAEDGIILLATQMAPNVKTLPHEMGHAFNLYHPFEGSADQTVCPDNTDCSLDGDQVCDTDPISYNLDPVTGVVDFTCRSGVNPCALPAGALYNDYTESNFMNYTNCFTLFTPGQKARMLASAASPYRLSLSTSQGAMPPGAGSSPCTIPKIDFELAGDQQTETTAATSGCLSYKDYTYNMVIGASPSATATVTLLVTGGNATRGMDYDLTTNGSFSSPSASLSFPAGTTASRSFSIRIYDDASVNGTRKFTLGFTVDNGGGNAIAGDGRPNFTMVIHDNDKVPVAGSPTGIGNIGVFSSYQQDVGPFDARQSQYKAQLQYTAAELTAAGVSAGPLSAISFNLQKASTRPYTNLNIKLGRSSAPFLVTNSNVTVGSPMNIVKTLSTYTTVDGWNNFTFDNPYIWDGTSNLVVEICYDNGTMAPGDAIDECQFYNEAEAGNQSNIFWQNGVNCSELFTSVAFHSQHKPIIRLSYGTPSTLVQSTLNASMQQRLGPDADIWFYDQASGELMARIQNLSSFDYGCTQVIIDRAGSGASPFWNNNTLNYLMDKTFHVQPTTNNPSGSYNITLFYTQAEVDGWQSATHQNISTIQLVKVPGQIMDVTAANPTGGGPITLVTPLLSALGTNVALTYNFSNGFSGFGAGIPGLSILPLGLLDFEGQLIGNNSLLDWSTSFEAGSKGFEIERSYDGYNFTDIGYVPGAGNSSVPLTYTFTDPQIAQENNYYRLKQIDQDGQFTYSKVIQIKDPNQTTRPFTVLSNPFTDHLDIVFGQLPVGKVKIRLLDMTGRALLSRSWEPSGGSRMSIDLSGTSISAGIYLLELRFNNSVRVEKILK